MKTIVMASRKGGVGKTTNVRNLAVCFANEGKKVLLVDTDAQGTLTQWFKRRSDNTGKPEDTIQLLQVAYDRLGEAVKVAEQAGIDVMLIDTPPDSNSAIQNTVSLADLILIPCKASPDDIGAVPVTHKLVVDLDKPYAFIVNEAKPNTVLLTLGLETLSQLGPVAPTQYSYSVIPTASLFGLTAIEHAPTSKAANDAQRLYQYVSTKLGDLSK